MSAALIVGATRGFGAALVSYCARCYSTVYATSRSDSAPASNEANVSWIKNIDLSKKTCGTDLAAALGKAKINTLIIPAGYYPKEEFGKADWDEEIKTYTLVSVAPVFVVEALVMSGALTKGSKAVLISSEGGSLNLRNDGGGDYAHHASKAALNMVGKQLSFDLKDKGIIVSIVHPSFMRTDMTRGVGFDKFWDSGSALHPEEAAKLVGDWVENELDAEKSGQFWAPRGTKDIGSWNDVMGKETAKDGPVQLPW